MIKVGDFWVDRYEASVWENADCTGTEYGGEMDNWADATGFPYHGSFSEPLFACSVAGVDPARFLTWFQAQAACAASGKRLLTNAQWQAAVAGTHDPGISSAFTGSCVTQGAVTRMTGSAGETPVEWDSCTSYWGVEDMIGNLWEWVEDWYGQGPDTGADGHQPDEYFGDLHTNIDDAPARGIYDTVFPAVGLRGGGVWMGAGSGAFAVHHNHTPSDGNPRMGFRCGVQ